MENETQETNANQEGEEIKVEEINNQDTGIAQVCESLVSNGKVDWIELALMRESLPKVMREPRTDRDFCKKYGIPESTFYFELNKTENKKKVIDLCFEHAKKRTPEVIKRLVEKAEIGEDDKSVEMFLEYILERKRKMETDINLNGTMGVIYLPRKDNDNQEENPKLEAPTETGDSVV